MKARNFAPGMGEAVARRTFAREGEEWSDICERVVKGNTMLASEPRKDRLLELMKKAVIIGAGRHLQNGDENQIHKNIEKFSNCSTAPTSALLFLLLLNGSGVGRSYDPDHIIVNWQNLRGVELAVYLSKEHPDYQPGDDAVKDIDYIRFIVPDTREGWAQSIEYLETKAFANDHRPVLFDFSQIRPLGAPIRGISHGTASGPQSLMRAFRNIIALINGPEMAPWKQAMFIDHYLAQEVQVGGVRRCLPFGKTFIHFASGIKKINSVDDLRVGDFTVGGGRILDVMLSGRQKLWRLTTDEGKVLYCTANHRIYDHNNRVFKPVTEFKRGDVVSACYGSDPEIVLKAWLPETVVSVEETEEWAETFDIETEFHQFFANGVLVHNSARMSTMSYTYPEAFEFVTIKNDNGLWSSNNSLIVDKEFWSDPKYEPLLMAALESLYKNGEPGFINGDELHDTKYKKFLGKDSFEVGSSLFYPTREHQEIITEVGRRSMRAKFPTITNPCVTADTEILTELGYKKVSELKFPNKVPLYVVDGQYWRGSSFFETGTKDVYRLTLESGHHVDLTADHKVFVEGGCVEAQKLNHDHNIILHDGTTSKMKSFDYLGKKRVYDASVPGINAFVANGIKVHNCGEIPLHLTGGLCIIGDVAPYFADTLDEAIEAAELMARFLVRVNMMPGIYHREVQRTNRIGVSLTGIHEFAWKFFKFTFYDLIDEEKSREFWDFLSVMRERTYRAADEYSRELMMNPPITVTTIKPAGSTSKLFALTEGAHLPAKKFYLRWVQFKGKKIAGEWVSWTDPRVPEYERKGYPIRELKTYRDVVIVGFPTAPLISEIMPEELIVTASEATPEEQYEWIRLLEKHWLGPRGGQVSYTLKFYTDVYSLEDFKRIVKQHQPTVRCCSVLPSLPDHMMGYEYLPEEAITKEEYENLLRKIAQADEEIDLERLRCENGACPLF